MKKKSHYNIFAEWRGFRCGINLMTGKKVVLLPDEYRMYTENPESLSNEIYRALVDGGFLLDEDADEYARLVHRRNSDVFYNNNTFKLTVLPTLECNFHCWYCYEKHIRGNICSSGNIDRVKKYVDYIINHNPIFNFHLDWFGGEPLLYYYDAVKPISEYIKSACQRNGLSFVNSMTTNCFPADKDMIEDFARIGLDRFQITLDGSREKHNMVRFEKRGDDSYARILENINTICRTVPDCMVNIRINYTNDNIKGISGIVNDIEPDNRSRVYFSLQRVWQTNSSENDKEIEDAVNFEIEAIRAQGIEVQYDSIVCGCGIRCYADSMQESVVNFDGDLYKCTARDFAKHQGIVGRLDEDGIPQWNDNYYKYCMKPIFDNSKCRECIYVPVCLGTCSQKYVENGVEAILAECRPEEYEQTIQEDLYRTLYNHITNAIHSR